jgi:Fe-Mn family superoxide dismutase
MPTIHRREFLIGAAAFSTYVMTERAWAQSAEGAYKLPSLVYPADALEPHIDAKTMEIHHDRHHAAYVNNLNAAVKDHPQVAQIPLEQMLARLDELPESVRTAIRNNGGGHANHTMFWQVMGKGGGQPSGNLRSAIDRDLGGLEKMQEQFNGAGGRVFGSGWVFVTVAPDGKLALATKPNQDTPLMDGGRVLFGNDVWEHAYYLKYQNRRADYLKAWWNVVDWTTVSERYASAQAGKLAI